MSVRRAPACQLRQRDSWLEPCEEQATRNLSRLSLVLAAGQRELATSAMNEDAKAEKRKRKEMALRQEELAEMMQQSLTELLARQEEVAQELMLYEMGVRYDADIRADLEREADLLEEAIAAKTATKEADDAAQKRAEEARKAEAAKEAQEAAAVIEERKQRLRDQEAEKERAKEENRGLGRHPNWDKAVNDPDNAAQYLKTKVDKEWWKKEGYKLAQRRELAKARERAHLEAWRSRRVADEVELARNAELRARRARYEQILAIVTSMEDDELADYTRAAAWSAYTMISEEDLRVFHEENLRLIREEVQVEAEVEKAAQAEVKAARQAREREAAAQEATRKAEQADQNDMRQVERRAAEDDARVAAERLAKEKERRANQARRQRERAQ